MLHFEKSLRRGFLFGKKALVEAFLIGITCFSSKQAIGFTPKAEWKKAIQMFTKSSVFPSLKGNKWSILVLLSLIYAVLFPQHSWAHYGVPQEMVLVGNYTPVYNPVTEISLIKEEPVMVLQGHTLIQTSNPITPPAPAVKTQGPSCPAPTGRLVIITAYSSSPDETYGDPFITASGSRVRDGIIATNFLKFGTKVQIPALYGDKIFVVEDRMARKNSHKVDIWMPSKAQALQFGVKRAEIVVLEN